MGYLHIVNLYREDGRDILLFKECYAMEKIHGTSCHISYDPLTQKLGFFSGGESYDKFVKLFNQDELKQKFNDLQIPVDKKVVIFGEGAGGKQQGMSNTYGPNLFFVAFDVKIGDYWLEVPKAEKMCNSLGIEFVHYVRVSTDLAVLDSERDADSVQAVRKGTGTGKKREGVVLRPLVEVRTNNGERVICKHKRDEFRETKSPRVVEDPEKKKVFEEAESVAEEWVVPMRLEHVLQRMPSHSIEKMKEIIALMVEDVIREGNGEFVPSPLIDKAVGKKTALLYKEYLRSKLSNNKP
jgi:hypothetical protein